MRGIACAVVLATVGILLVSACGDRNNADSDIQLVHVFGRTVKGHRCPSGTTEAYRDRNLLACNSCVADADCGEGFRCKGICGPGCEHDTGGCCVVTECIEFQ